MTSRILFFDIESVPLYYPYDSLPDVAKELWGQKFSYLTNTSPEEHYDKAGIYSEFSRVFCIGYAYLKSEGNYTLGVLKGEEKTVLLDFSSLLTRLSKTYTLIPCAHNGKEFDFPFLCRRYLVNHLPIPTCLNFQGKKPWEINACDTMQMWKFGDVKNYTSLDLLSYLFNIPSPKKKMKGSDICKKVFEEKAYEDVYEYCLEDVKTLVRIYYHLTERHQEASKLIFTEATD